MLALDILAKEETTIEIEKIKMFSIVHRDGSIYLRLIPLDSVEQELCIADEIVEDPEIKYDGSSIYKEGTYWHYSGDARILYGQKNLHNTKIQITHEGYRLKIVKTRILSEEEVEEKYFV